MFRKSIAIRLLSYVLGAFIVTALSVLLLADFQVKDIINRSQNAIYQEKLEGIIRMLDIKVEKLKATGLRTAYEEDFQESVLKTLRQTYYKSTDQQIYPFIVNMDGEVIVHPVFPRGDRSLKNTSYMRKMLELKNGDFSYTDERGDVKWCIFTSFGEWNWIVGFAVPLEIKYADAGLLRDSLAVIMAVIVSIVILALSAIIARVTRPIVTLTEASKAIASGDLSQPIDTNGEDELGILAGSFARMRDSIQEKIAALDEKNRELVREITERKRAEVVLRESENRYHTLFDSANDAIFIMKDDLFIDCNRMTLEMFGCTREQIINQPPYRFSPPVQPDGRGSREKALEKIEAAYNGNPQFFEWEHQKYDGTHFDAEVSLNSVELGSRKYLQAIVRDITGRKEAEEELERHRTHLEDLVKERTRELEAKTEELKESEKALIYLLEDVNEIKDDLEKANEQLKELDELKTMFIASMSHELRTPLNSIIGFTGIILQGLVGEINEEQRDQLNRVYGSAKHLLNLISDAIDISKIEAGKIKAYTEECQLDKIIKEAVSTMGNQIDNKGLGLETSISQGLKLTTDSRRLLQCILNYLSNSVKFTEKGEIIITAHESDGMVEISVKDTGIGIKEEDVPKLFNSFVRLDSPLKLKTPGNGLGLYLTKKLAVEVLGGSVSVESSFGEGSTFVLRIPKEL